MKKINITILISLICFLGSCSFQNLAIDSVEKPNLQDLSHPKTAIVFNINLNNPNSVGFKLAKSDLKVFVNQVDVGTVSMNTSTKIKANGITAVPVALNIDNSKLLSIAAMSLFTEPKVQVRGILKGRKFIFTKRYPVNFEDTFSIQDFLGE